MTKLSQRQIGQRLQDLCAAGKFHAAFLTGPDGLPIAHAASERDADTDAAFLGLLHRVVQQVRQALGLADLDEVSLVDGAGTRIVCRYLPVNDRDLFLVVFLPARKPYRRLTNRLIRELAGR